MIPIGFEPMAYCLEGSCSIQLSYGTVINKERMRTNKEPFTTHFISQSFYLIRKKAFTLLPGFFGCYGLNCQIETCNKSGWQDSNLRPPGPKPGAMTGLRYTPIIFYFTISVIIAGAKLITLI